MGCGDVQRIAYFFLDGTVSSARCQAVRSHLESCPSCRDRLLIHQRFRAFVKKRLAGPAAPETLRLRILDQVRALKSEAGVS